MIRPGERIGERFLVEGLVSEGGTAAVYRVRHTRLGTLFALKLLTPRSPLPAERLLREGRIQATLQHPCILNVVDVLDVGGGYGLVMEYIDGPTLAGVGRLPPETAAVVVADVFGAVASAHAQGVLHRDLKPQNVLMAPVAGGWLPKVADFGIARLAREAGAPGVTRIGFGMGTPGYVAPEQIRDAASVDARADLYSLGVLYYELLAHHLPFGADLGERPPFHPVAGVPEAVNEALRALLAVDPEARPGSIEAAAEALFGDDPELRDIAAGRLPPRPVALAGVARPTDGGPSATLLPADSNLTMVPTAASPEPAPPAAPAPAPDRRGGPWLGGVLGVGLGALVVLGGVWWRAGDAPSGLDPAEVPVSPASPAPPVPTALAPSPSPAPPVASPLPAAVPPTAAPPPVGTPAGGPATPVAAPAPAPGVPVPPPEAAPPPAPSPEVPVVAELSPAVTVAETSPTAVASPPPAAPARVPVGTWSGSAGGRPFVIRIGGTAGALTAEVSLTLGTTDRVGRYTGRVEADGRIVLTEVDGVGRLEGHFSDGGGRGTLTVGKGKPLPWEVGS